MKLYNKILIVTDFNEEALNKCLSCYNSLFADNSEVHLLNVIEDTGFITRLFASYANSFEECVKSRFPIIKDTIKERWNINVKLHVRKGSISKEIVELCNEEEINLIIMLVSNDNSLDVIGANTHKLLRLTNVPILTMRRNHEIKQIKNILIPLELYLSSRQKVADAVMWAKYYNAKITICLGLWDKDKETAFKVKRIGQTTMDFIESKGIECKCVTFDNLDSSKDYTLKIVDYANEPANNVDIAMVMNKDESIDFRIDDRGREIIRLSQRPILCVPLKKTGMSAGFL
ncbi:MAG: universal stress protein [Bacteroidales bacterium]|nr:universal stress protein [Bacteroidales bacterium]